MTGPNGAWALALACVQLVSARAVAQGDADFSTDFDDDSAPVVANETRSQVEPVNIRLESGILGRAFRYTDPLADHGPGLERPVDNVTPATPMLRLRVESYPLAALTQAWPARLGLHVDLVGALPTNVRGGPNQPVRGSQSQGQLLLGAQAQVDWAGLEFVPRVAWGLHGWYLRLDDGSAPPFPDVTYSFLELGLQLRAKVDALVFEGDLGFRPGFSAGPIQNQEWFPNTTFWGMTTGASAGWAFHPTLTLRLHVEFVQYGLTFDPEVGRPPSLVAGGATDQSVLTTLGLEWRLPPPP